MDRDETIQMVEDVLSGSYADRSCYIHDVTKTTMVYHSKTMITMEVLTKISMVAKIIGIQANNNRRLFSKGYELSVYYKEK